MIGLIRANQQVDVHEALLGRDIQPQFNIGKDQFGLGEATCDFVFHDLFVCLSGMVVGHRNGIERGRHCFERSYVIFPR